MAKLERVTITKEANIYYDGSVTSRSVELEDGTDISLGIMLPGEYTFNTDRAEDMEILSGNIEVRLPEEEFKTITAPDSFSVAANSSFDVRVKTVSDYCCRYID